MLRRLPMLELVMEKNFFDAFTSLSSAWNIWPPGAAISANGTLRGATLVSLDDEKILNGGFETAGGGGADVFASWGETIGEGAIERTTTVGEFRSGSAAAKLTRGGNPTAETQYISVIPGISARLSFWYRATGAGTYRIYDATNAAFIKYGNYGASASFAQVVYDFSVPNTCKLLGIFLYAPDSAGEIVYLDDVSCVSLVAGIYRPLYPSMTILASVSIPASPDATPRSLIVRRVDDDNYIELLLLPNTTGFDTYLKERISGTYATADLAWADVDWVAGAVNDVRIVVTGATIAVWVDKTQSGTFLPALVCQYTTEDTDRNIGALAYDTAVDVLDRLIVNSGGGANPTNLFVVGDSKSDYNDNWPFHLIDGLHAATGNLCGKGPREYGEGGYTVAQMKTYVDANLSGETLEPDYILCNLGANDVSALPVEATWKSDYTSIIDSFRAKWPSASIYIVKPWRRTYDANCGTVAGWIDAIVATYASGVAVGHDERTWLEGGDNGVTMTTDGVHYSTAGQIECAAQWLAILTA